VSIVYQTTDHTVFDPWLLYPQ